MHKRIDKIEILIGEHLLKARGRHLHFLSNQAWLLIRFKKYRMHLPLYIIYLNATKHSINKEEKSLLEEQEPLLCYGAPPPHKPFPLPFLYVCLGCRSVSAQIMAPGS